MATRAAGFLRRYAGVLAIVSLALGAATVVQTYGWNQTSHYALIRSLDQGTPWIDRYRRTTGDKAHYKGHVYSARAPGTAFASLPYYKALRISGVTQHLKRFQHGKNDEAIWLLGLWAALLPAIATMLLVRWMGNRLEPGYGTAAALALGAGTLFLPYGTMLFSHVFSAFLGFAAFALLWRERERDGPDRLWVYAVAGLIIGYAITTEYPLLFVGIILGLYAITRGHAVKRGLVYAGGVAVGVVPLALFDKWAYGSFTHVAYADIPKNQGGFFGIRLPSPVVAVELLFDSRGLLLLAPVLIMGIVGTVLLYRRGGRAEALVIAAVGVAYLAYNSGYYLPFGGQTPGPRFLITTLPFLALPLALSFKRFPIPTLALAAASVACMSIATLGTPLVSAEGDTGTWMHLIEQNYFQASVVTLATGIDGWAAFIPFYVLVAGAGVLAWMATPRGSASWRALATGAAVVGTWGLIAIFAPRVLGIDHAAEERIVAAGDPSAVHEKYGSHPISHVVFVALGLTLITLAAAALLSRRDRPEKPARADPAEGQPAPASVA
ncbi:MAG: hypothetical protein QOJ12_2217 [Thermoleophilales bacterium]|nr:hypothetical protein [Thermoleophilales bacterium]